MHHFLSSVPKSRPYSLSPFAPKMSDVPSELFREILLRLPAESLFRFRSVCKKWLRIIDDPSFIKAHTNNQIHNHTLLIRNKTGAPLFSFSLDSLKYVKDLQEIDATRIKQLFRHGVPRLPALFNVASCNGLILISHENIQKKIWAIWNPLTGDCHELPRPNFAVNSDGFGFGFGFGYDCDGDDYKVVRVDKVLSKEKDVYQTLVYSLKSDSWSMIEDCPGYISLSGVYFNGRLYWISQKMIIALDLRTESYCELPLPPVMDKHVGYRLDAYDGCLIFGLNYYNKDLFDGWAMKDNGVEKSWIKLFSLQLPDSITEPSMDFKLVAYLKGKQQVVMQNSRGFVWFDIASNSVLNFSVHGFPRIASSKICPGSLVRLKARGSDITAGKTSTKKRKRNSKKSDARLKICVRDVEDDECEECSCFDNQRFWEMVYED